MIKIPTLFERNFGGDHLVRPEVVPGCEWVIAGEGRATRKYDGTCCMIRNQVLFKRYELKAGKNAPPGFEPAQLPDSSTGNIPGWVPVGPGPEDVYHRVAFERKRGLPDGTYELCGPKIQGNPEEYENPILIPHGCTDLPDCPLEFEAIKRYLSFRPFEGVVWHHPDGRMAKIKKTDFWRTSRNSKSPRPSIQNEARSQG